MTCSISFVTSGGALMGTGVGDLVSFSSVGLRVGGNNSGKDIGEYVGALLGAKEDIDVAIASQKDGDKGVYVGNFFFVGRLVIIEGRSIGILVGFLVGFLFGLLVSFFVGFLVGVVGIAFQKDGDRGVYVGFVIIVGSLVIIEGRGIGILVGFFVRLLDGFLVGFKKSKIPGGRGAQVGGRFDDWALRCVPSSPNKGSPFTLFSRLVSLLKFTPEVLNGSVPDLIFSFVFSPLTPKDNFVSSFLTLDIKRL
jgi:hypothetical protein